MKQIEVYAALFLLAGCGTAEAVEYTPAEHFEISAKVCKYTPDCSDNGFGKFCTMRKQCDEKDYQVEAANKRQCDEYAFLTVVREAQQEGYESYSSVSECHAPRKHI
jgi:adenine-specific DNA glycosylase